MARVANRAGDKVGSHAVALSKGRADPKFVEMGDFAPRNEAFSDGVSIVD